MTSDIAAILAVDGIATGAIYALVAIGTVLIFTVTRVIFIPFGDIAAFTALTLAALDAKQFPGTGGLVVVLACLATLIEIASLARAGELRLVPRALLFYLALPLATVGVIIFIPLPGISRESWLLLYNCCAIFVALSAYKTSVPVPPAPFSTQTAKLKSK